jgi:hypothetical protein
MFKYYQHKNFQHVIYFNFYNEVSKEDATEVVKILKSLYPVLQKRIILFQEYDKEAVLKDKQFLDILAKNAHDHFLNFESATIIGIVGIRKVLFNLYLNLKPGKMKRILVNSRDEAWALSDFKLLDDFILISKSPE